MKKTLITVVVTMVVMGTMFCMFLVRNGFVTAKANVATHKTETYVDGVLVETSYSNELLGCGMDINYNQSMYVGR